MPFMLPPPGFDFSAQASELDRMERMKAAAREEMNYREALRMTLFERDQWMIRQDEERCRSQGGYNEYPNQPLWNASGYGSITPPMPQRMPMPIPTVRPTQEPGAPYYLCDPSSRWPGQAYVPPPPPPRMQFDPFGMDDFNPTAYLAPAMNPRSIYPMDINYQSYNAASRRASPTRPPRAVSVNEAISYWYAEQVVLVLLKPGMRRPGVGGSSDDIWGPTGRWRDEWERMDIPAPSFTRDWGRLGFDTPQSSPRYPQYQHTNAQDPWNIAYQHERRVNKQLVAFVYEMVQRMTISPTATVAASWYLYGLGLHDCDGQKGEKLREVLQQVDVSNDEMGIEKRIALLGLLLAGKWLDDNSFLTKSWTEVTTIPVKEVDLIERTALADLHWSLSLPIGSWADHVNKSWADLMGNLENLSDENHVMLPLLDDMVTEARSIEVHGLPPTTSYPPSPTPASIEKRRSSRPKSQVFYSPISTYSRRLSNGSSGGFDSEYCERIDRRLEELYGEGVLQSTGTPLSQYYSPRPYPAERGEIRGEGEGLPDLSSGQTSYAIDDTETDDGYDVEYDGAQRFLPSLSELNRSNSNSSSYGTRDRIYEEREESPFAFSPPPIDFDSLPPEFFVKDRPDHERFCSAQMRCEPNYIPPAQPLRRMRAPTPPMPLHSQELYGQAPTTASRFKETGLVYEPGITQVRPPTANNHGFGFDFRPPTSYRPSYEYDTSAPPYFDNYSSYSPVPQYTTLPPINHYPTTITGYH